MDANSPKAELTIALAGNANVGKSVLFNHMTHSSQTIGNWPGKTVERAEGHLIHRGYSIKVIDLPGIYSLSTYSLEEIVSREYIARGKPDLVIDVIDASVLERNLFFTLQLIELDRPMIIALNQMDLARKKGVKIDPTKLEKILGIPVIQTVATKATGVSELLDRALDAVKGGINTKPLLIRYGAEVEETISTVESLLTKIESPYPQRWLAIKLLEGDPVILSEIMKIDSSIPSKADAAIKKIERLHGEPASLTMVSERYTVANRIAGECQEIIKPHEPNLSERLEDLTIHRIWGYPIMAAVVSLSMLAIFSFGNLTSNLLSGFLNGFKPILEAALGTGPVGALIWDGLIQGLIAVATIALPYLVPFYILLAMLEDSGYLARIAFLMDSVMHKMGLHGKAFIPMILGYGCNVPACLGCRIMETPKERELAAFVATMIPCAARTVVILGVVGAYLGLPWVFLLYAFNLVVVFALGRVAFKMFVGESAGLIMEMPSYRVPSSKVLTKQTWFRIKDFIYIAFPLIVMGSIALEGLKIIGVLDPLAQAMSPVTVGWLGLPVITGIVLILGILRKELTLIMLASLAGTTNIAAIMSPVQMIVFTLVVMFYIPCVSTIAALVKEFGYRKAAYITLFEIAFATLIGGLALRVIGLAMW